MAAVQTVTCLHCGQPGVRDDSQFCCNGCRVAYELIHGWGLDDYYALRDRDAGVSVSDPSCDHDRYAAFDSATYLGRSAPTAHADGLLACELAVHGLHCAACAWLIENAAARTEGWTAARVKLVDHTIKILFNPGKIQLSKIARLLGQLGYELAPLTHDANDPRRLENRRLLAQIAIAGFCAANAMWIAIALYAGDASGVAAEHRDFLRWFGTALGILAVAFPGRTFFVGALASLKTRTPHMDLPVALGLSIGTVVGTRNALFSTGDVYFDSLAVLVFLLLVGRWIQFRQQSHAANSVALLLRITPRHARRKVTDSHSELVVTEALDTNDLVEVRAGESIPADGRISRGTTLIDRSLLTGESEPEAAGIGDVVYAGTVNLQQPIEFRVTDVGAQTRIGNVMKSVEEALAVKPPIVQLADRVGGVFVVVVTALAVITLVVWSGDGLSVAASHATALLIVACPCALALATPLAIAVSIGRAAKQKILIRDGAALQQLSRTGRIWFDKTGTLTEGRVAVEHVAGAQDAIALAAAVERQCSHPIGDAIVRLAKPAADALQVTGTSVGLGGVSAICAGKQVVVGNVDYIADQKIKLDDALARATDRLVGSGFSPVLIAVDGVVVTVLSVVDRPRSEAAEIMLRLRRRGWEVGILSGDRPQTVRQFARLVGIDPSEAFGGLSPEQKLQKVRQAAEPTVVMVGDGANDAAALAAADVGIAVRGGAEVSLQAAPLYISSGHLADVVKALDGSRSAMRLIAAAFSVSLGYNLLAVGMAMAGQITPLIAAILMPISSVSVLGLTLAWPTFAGSKS